MRILQLCSASQLGGGEIHVADLVRALVERGHALFLAVRPNSPLRGLLSGVITSWREMPMKNSLDIKSAAAITEIINQHDIDIVHAHVGRDYLIAAMACRCCVCMAAWVSTPPPYAFQGFSISAITASGSSSRTNADTARHRDTRKGTIRTPLGSLTCARWRQRSDCSALRCLVTRTVDFSRSSTQFNGPSHLRI